MGDGDIEDQTKNWTDHLTEVIKTYIPHKEIYSSPLQKPWFNEKIAKLRKKKRKYHAKAIKTNSVEDWSEYRRLRNKANKQIWRSKHLEQLKQAKKLEEAPSEKTWWKIAKRFYCQTHFLSCAMIATCNNSNKIDDRKPQDVIF